MYAYIKGMLAGMEEDAVIVEAGGIGYHIYTTGQTFKALPCVGETIKVYTYLHVREDAVLLFGFLTRDDLRIFKLLIGVSGIGPKGALAILSVMTTDDLRFAVAGDDAKAIAKAPGVGIKTAQRLILELKDRLSIEDIFGDDAPGPAADGGKGMPGVKEEAVQALVSLGYSPMEAAKAVSGVADTDNMEVEAVLKAALRNMAFL